MSAETAKMEFTPTQHAMLFAWISRELVQKFGEDRAGSVIRLAVRKYGNQRGRRMALRAEADGRPLNMFNYLVYGEWSAPEGEMQTEDSALNPHLRTKVHKCPWSTAWKGSGLTEYGKYYCMEVDEALAEGYNPQLTLEVFQTMTNGADFCDFGFNDAHLNAENTRLLAEQKAAVKDKSVKSWDYHIAHLVKTMSSVIRENFGSEGKEAIQKALLLFEETYGSPALEAVQSKLLTDFDQLPEE